MKDVLLVSHRDLCMNLKSHSLYEIWDNDIKSGVYIVWCWVTGVPFQCLVFVYNVV